MPLPRAQASVSGILAAVGPWLSGKTSKALPRRQDRTGKSELGFKTSKCQFSPGAGQVLRLKEPSITRRRLWSSPRDTRPSLWYCQVSPPPTRIEDESEAVAKSFLLDVEEMSKVSQTGKALNDLKRSPWGKMESNWVWGRSPREAAGSARMTESRMGGQRSRL